MNKMQNKFSRIVVDGVNDLSDFFHKIKYSRKVLDLNDDNCIKSLIYILNTFFVNQVTEIAAKSTFIENATNRKMDRKERMVMVAQDCLQIQKDMFETIIAYQVDRNNARK